MSPVPGVPVTKISPLGPQHVSPVLFGEEKTGGDVGQPCIHGHNLVSPQGEPGQQGADGATGLRSTVGLIGSE